MSDEICSWETDEATFYVTSATTAVMEIVKTNPFVVITGSPGMGKSVTARHIALSLRSTDIHDILPVQHPGEIIKYFEIECNQIFVVDDIFGKFCAETNLIRKWEKNEQKLRQILKNTTSLKIIGTCRLHIFNNEKVQNIVTNFGMKECNLKSKNFCITFEEKQKIATHYCDEHVLSQLSDDIVNQFDMFPLLCATASRKGDNKSVDLFKNPYGTFEQELIEMQHRSEDDFVGLLLLVIFNNKLKINLLNDRRNKSLDKIFNEIFEICRLNRKPIKHHILSALHRLDGTYTHVSHVAIRAVHDKIFDIISYYIGSHFIELILEHGSSKFIYQRIQLESLKEEHNEYTIMVKSELEDIYFQRLLKDIKSQKLATVFENNQIKYKTFQENFLSSLSSNPDIQSLFINNQWSLCCSVHDDRKLMIDFIIDKLSRQRELASDRCCNKEYISVVDQSDTSDEEMMKNIVFFKQKDSAFIIAAAQSEVNIVKILLDNFDIDVNSIATYQSKQLSALTVACTKGHTDIASLLVNKYNCDVNLKCNGKSPLHYACEMEHPDLIDILLSAKCDVNALDEDQKSPLYVSCEKGNLDIVQILLQAGCNVDVAASSGLRPVDVARDKGNKTIEQALQTYIRRTDI